MKIQFVRSYGHYRRGQVVETLPDGVANVFLRIKVAEQVKDEKKAKKK